MDEGRGKREVGRRENERGRKRWSMEEEEVGKRRERRRRRREEEGEGGWSSEGMRMWEFTLCLSQMHPSIHCFLTSAISGIDPLVLSLVVHPPSILYCTVPMQDCTRHR